MLDPQESPEEIKSREMELGSESWTTLCVSCSPTAGATDFVLLTLLRTAVETTINGVHKLLRTGVFPTALT